MYYMHTYSILCLSSNKINLNLSLANSRCVLQCGLNEFWGECRQPVSMYGSRKLIIRHNNEKLVLLQGEVPYLKDHWCQFDASMVFFLWVSVILQMFEMLGIVPRFSYLSILRSPRPLIMIRFIRVFLKFSMPKSRINQIFK